MLDQHGSTYSQLPATIEAVQRAYQFPEMDFAANCIETPENLQCRDFKLSNNEIEEKLSKLCSHMPGMPVCYLKSSCNTKIPACAPFSLLSSVCKYDMPKMHDCKDYNRMCTESSVIKQCVEHPIPSFPTSNTTKSLIDSICSEMDMPGCSKCRDKPCDLLKEYVHLCHQVSTTK